MNKKREKRGYIIFSAIFYGIATALMIFGTFCDLKIDEALFAPGQTFARLAESYGQFVYWGMWGPPSQLYSYAGAILTERSRSCPIYHRK